MRKAGDMMSEQQGRRLPARRLRKRKRYSWTAAALIPAWTSGIAYWLCVGMYVDATSARMPGGLGLMVRFHQYWLISLFLTFVLLLGNLILLEEAYELKKRAKATPYGYRPLAAAAALGVIFIGLLVTIRIWAV